MTSHTVIVPLVVAAVSRRCGGYLAATSLTFLKPRFKRFLMPVSARLARAGVIANQVTTVSIVGSLIMGGMLSLFHSHSILFGLLPVWVLVRMGCATIDGTLAIDFGQKSRLGGVLNEVGDVVSDVVLFLPLAFVVPFSASSVGTVVVLAISSEVAGMLGPALGGSRRVDGPMGKADRGIALGILGLWTCCGGPLPSEAAWATLPFGCLLAITTANRLYLARTEGLGAGR
jgi:CDP-diacylglycerol--glycerol-3-phosphate 3-phosphatidyltransferase